VKASLWEGREGREGKVVNPLDDKAARRTQGKVRFHGIEEQVASVSLKNQEVAKDCVHREKAPTKVLCQREVIQALGASAKHSVEVMVRWGAWEARSPRDGGYRRSSSPAPCSEQEACLSSQGKLILREEGVSDKGVSVFNAKVELYNCRD
jgi:hypothetical protein